MTCVKALKKHTVLTVYRMARGSKQPPKSAAKARKAPKKVEEPAVVEPEPEPTKVAEVAEQTVSASMEAECTEFSSRIQKAAAEVNSLKAQFKKIEKLFMRQMKAAEREAAKKKKRQGSRSPSGFVKPTKISDELAAFLGRDSGTEMARTEVTREINAYIREKGLQDPSNGRRILADTRLSKLLSLGKQDELTYFNLQRYMSPHFAKAGSN